MSGVCGYLTANDTCQTQVSHRDGLKLTGALLALKAAKYQLLNKQLAAASMVAASMAAASMAAASHDLCSTFRHDLKMRLSFILCSFSERVTGEQTGGLACYSSYSH